jgi:predicted permease
MLSELLTIVAPTFLCAGAGFVWGRWGPRYDRDVITSLITNIGMPCLVFSSLVRLQLEPRAMAQMAGSALLAFACFAAIGAVVLRVWRLPTHTYLAPLIFGNAGNMGLPLCLYAFGPEGLALAICFYATAASTHFTLGLLIWSGRLSLAELARNPLFAAAVAAILVIVTDFNVPAFVLNTTELLGGFALPLMLLTLGVSISELHTARLGRTTALSLLRLGMGVAVSVALAHVLGLEGRARSVFILEASMPVAVFNYLLAERYQRSPEQVASLVVVSTLIAFALLPVLLWFLV